LCFQEKSIRRPAYTQDSRHVDGGQIQGGIAVDGLLKLLVQTLSPVRTPVLIECD